MSGLDLTQFFADIVNGRNEKGNDFLRTGKRMDHFSDKTLLTYGVVGSAFAKGRKSSGRTLMRFMAIGKTYDDQRIALVDAFFKLFKIF